MPPFYDSPSVMDLDGNVIFAIDGSRDNYLLMESWRDLGLKYFTIPFNGSSNPSMNMNITLLSKMLGIMIVIHLNLEIYYSIIPFYLMEISKKYSSSYL